MLKVIKTLKCDFHIHTVFSDGKVWPDIRVAEAWQEGLDAIAITDHIEYRPNKEILKEIWTNRIKLLKMPEMPSDLWLFKEQKLPEANPWDI